MAVFPFAANVDVILSEKKKKKKIEQEYPRCTDRQQYPQVRQACVSREFWHELERSRVVLAIQLEKVCEENELLISAWMLSMWGAGECIQW